MKYVQSGYNTKYPQEIETWRLGEIIPDWLSDRAKINFIDGEGNLTLDIHETSSGGYEIMNSGGTGTLILLRSKKDYICFGGEGGERRIFPLSQVQLELLYNPSKQKENGREKSIKSK